MTTRRVWLVAALAVGVVSACATGPSPGESNESIAGSQATTALPVLVSDSVAYDTPTEAALAAALGDQPDIVDPQVIRIVGIYADQTSVDLRVEVHAEGLCRWYGVLGSVEGAAIRWRAGPALPCDPTG